MAVARVEQDAEAQTVIGLACRFTALVRGCGIQRRQRGSQIPADIETFAAELKTDGAAVRAASTHAWSSGQGEEQVNRLKLLKRQSDGRARFDMLRRRVLLAA